MMLVMLSAVCVIGLRRKKYGKIVYTMLAVMFICTTVISPITNRSEYGQIYLDSISSTDQATAIFATTYSAEGQSFTGDSRLNAVVRLIKWPNLMTLSSEFEKKVEDNDFVYSSTVIVANPTTPFFVATHGVNDMVALSYLKNLFNESNPVYSNGWNVIFIPK